MSNETEGVFITIPLPDKQIFRYEAADDILELLYRNPYREFTVTELRNTTDHGGKSVDNAIQILGSLQLVQTEKKGRSKLVKINQKKIRKPDDSILEIPQEQFRTPVKTFLDQILDEHENLVGVILFGSVARGEADRRSDIDIQIIVKDDLTESRRELQKIRKEVEEQRFDGERYEIQLLVESVESAKNYGEKLQEIFSRGITLYSTEKLDEVKAAVF
jgi:predicted nucleotidyltransferase